MAAWLSFVDAGDQPPASVPPGSPIEVIVIHLDHLVEREDDPGLPVSREGAGDPSTRCAGTRPRGIRAGGRVADPVRVNPRRGQRRESRGLTLIQRCSRLLQQLRQRGLRLGKRRQQEAEDKGTDLHAVQITSLVGPGNDREAAGEECRLLSQRQRHQRLSGGQGVSS